MVLPLGLMLLILYWSIAPPAYYHLCILKLGTTLSSMQLLATEGLLVLPSQKCCVSVLSVGGYKWLPAAGGNAVFRTHPLGILVHGVFAGAQGSQASQLILMLVSQSGSVLPFQFMFYLLLYIS